MKGITGDNMLQLLELRLDNVVYRLGLGKTRRMAPVRSLCHGHIRVNGQKVDIPSYSVKVGDVITLRQQSTESGALQAAARGHQRRDPQVADLRCPQPDRQRGCAARPVRTSSLEAEMST